MISLFLLLFAAASVVVGSDRVSGGLSRRSAGARLLVGVPAVVALGVLVGWPVLHLGAGGVAVSVLVATAWLCCGLVSQVWWDKSLRAYQRKRLGWSVSEGGEGGWGRSSGLSMRVCCSSPWGSVSSRRSRLDLGLPR